MGADRIVMPPPGFDQHLCFCEAVEYLAIEQFIAKGSVEALVVAIFPWRSRGDVERLHADLRQPFLDCRRDKFAAIVGPDIGRWPTRDEQVG